MRAIIQRVSEANVTVDGTVTGKIGKGFLILLGVTGTDAEKHAEVMARKITALRVFTDAHGKMNLPLADVGGRALVVSQFTLYADTAKGNRPSFTQAAPPEQANRLYEYFCECLRKNGVEAETGTFGADMRVSLLNDGPVTICLDTRNWNI